MSFEDDRGFAGDLSVEDAYAMLAKEENAALVDVRTQPEWQFVGVPDLASLGKEAIFREWQTYPAMQVAEDFVQGLADELQRRGRRQDQSSIFSPLRRALPSRRDRIDERRVDALLQHRRRIEGPLDGERRRGATGAGERRACPGRRPDSLDTFIREMTRLKHCHD